jgi:DNA-binding GntR family transcriptional regulator
MPPRSRLPRLPKLNLSGSPFAALMPTRDTLPQLLSELRRALLDGEIAPGAPLLPGDLARRFSTTPVAVREVLPALIAEGLAEPGQDAEYAATHLAVEELREMHLMRESMEATALAAAVTRAGAEDHRRATETYQRLDDAVRRDDPVEYHRQSLLFHLALTRPSGMRRLVHLLESVCSITEPTLSMIGGGTEEHGELHADHRRQLDAFRARDVAELLLVAEQHHARLVIVGA